MPREISPTVYLLASRRNGTLYVGVTSNLLQRISQHRGGQPGSFTAEYDIKTLVWFESHPTMESAILREKRLKAWKRGGKLGLIETLNPDWRDLATDFGFDPLPLDYLR
ncbi:GIY-YIG nuclease family protein [Novosphingobium sp.]|uniref:GIY-YIG nuclease family protein n=1 Tax=Novosphingobium sp. TaxID=1874826 RepID=UPI003D0F9760